MKNSAIRQFYTTPLGASPDRTWGTRHPAPVPGRFRHGATMAQNARLNFLQRFEIRPLVNQRSALADGFRFPEVRR
jgi:hypothetical protein